MLGVRPSEPAIRSYDYRTMNKIHGSVPQDTYPRLQIAPTERRKFKSARFPTQTPDGSLTCYRNGLGDVHDLDEDVFHRDTVLHVQKVVGTDDRLERMGCRGLSRVVPWPVAAWYISGRDDVVTARRDVERLSGLENQDEEVVSLVVRKFAPECRSGQGIVQRGYVFN